MGHETQGDGMISAQPAPDIVVVHAHAPLALLKGRGDWPPPPSHADQGSDRSRRGCMAEIDLAFRVCP
jgi:hypothetical protein